MSVLIQQQIHSEYSFIIHTHNPITKNANEVYIELAVGLGETLASANQSGTPYRLIYDKKSKECHILSFSNYSTALFANRESKTAKENIVDYSLIDFSSSLGSLVQLGM